MMALRSVGGTTPIAPPRAHEMVRAHAARGTLPGLAAALIGISLSAVSPEAESAMLALGAFTGTHLAPPSFSPRKAQLSQIRAGCLGGA